MRFSEWFLEESEVDLSYLLSPPSQTRQIGPEKGNPVGDGIARYVEPFQLLH